MLERFARGVRRTPRAYPRGARRAKSLLLTAFALALLGAAAFANRERIGPRVPAPAMFTGVAPESDSLRRMQLVVVAQRRDCDGNLSFAGFVARARLRGLVVVRQLLIEGSAADTLGLRVRLPNVLRDVPISLLTRRQREVLMSLGHRATPVFLLLDEQSRLLAALPVDPDPVHRISYLRAIVHLITHDPKS